MCQSTVQDGKRKEGLILRVVEGSFFIHQNRDTKAPSVTMKPYAQVTDVCRQCYPEFTQRRCGVPVTDRFLKSFILIKLPKLDNISLQ